MSKIILIILLQISAGCIEKDWYQCKSTCGCGLCFKSTTWACMYSEDYCEPGYTFAKTKCIEGENFVNKPNIISADVYIFIISITLSFIMLMGMCMCLMKFKDKYLSLERFEEAFEVPAGPEQN